jgi:hypothetical protein
MNHELARLFAQRVAEGLQRRSVTSCSRWAERYRVMGGRSFPGPWTFTYHPWLRGMHDSEAELNVGMKAAQMGFTETALNIVFYHIDIKAVDVLYVLPAQTPDASDFSAARFDPALEMSPHLEHLFSDVKNVGHKRAGSTNLYIRGSRSRSGLKSIPTGLIILDEVAEMTAENIPLALERAAGQLEKMVWMLSTPTVHRQNIHQYYLNSSQNHFQFSCPRCSRFTELVFPECLVITAEDLNDPRVRDSHLVCKDCKGVLPHETKPDWLSTGRWESSFTDRDSAGWHISQLYSPTVKPSDIARTVLLAQSDPAAEQELYNSKLGLPHAVDGARITDEDLETSKRGYKRSDARGGGFLTMGVDVGKVLHYEIDQWILPPPNAGHMDINVASRCKLLTYGKLREFEELDRLMHEFGVHFCVIDANPERRKALEFANRFHGRVRLCFYGRGIQGKVIHVSEAEATVTVDRTSWLDLSLSRFRRSRHDDSIIIPYDVDAEYCDHLKAPVRVYLKDKDGNPVGRYDEGNSPDHYAHARNYAEIALPLGMTLGDHEHIGSFL